MNKSNFLFGLVGLLAGFIVGFIIANSVNHGAGQPPRPLAPARAGETGNKNQAAPADSSELTEAEVREAIATADQKPDDIYLQRNLGLVLYRYAIHTQDMSYLPDVARFLKRAYDADPKDRDIAVSLGNVLFDMGQKSDPARLAEARVYYEKALAIKADDADVRTDLGRTYYMGKPSDPKRAIAEYRKSLAINARHEATLQNLAAALIVTGSLGEAQTRIEELQGLNPSNPALSNLRAQLAQSKNAQE